VADRGRDVAFAALCLAVGLLGGYAATSANSTLLWSIFGAFGAVILYRVVAPRGRPVGPWRIFLPALVLYNALALALERPPSLASQAWILAGFSAAFFVGSLIASARPRARERERQSDVLRAPSADLLWLIEVPGILITAYLMGTVGAPLLSPDSESIRRALAEQALLLTIGRAALHVSLVIALLRLFGRVEYGYSRPQKRGPRIWTPRSQPKEFGAMNVVLLLGLLVLSGGRGAFLVPIALVAVYLILTDYRNSKVIVSGLVVSVGAFLWVGIARIGSGGNWYAPVENYAVGTAQVEDRALRTFPWFIPHQNGEVFFWFKDAIPGGVEPNPPGIWLRDAFQRDLTGFGLEPGIIVAFFIDFGYPGIFIGAVVVGWLAQVFFMRHRARGGWATVAYAYVLTWLLLSITQHPIASYYYIVMPVMLWWAWSLTRGARSAVVEDDGTVKPQPRFRTAEAR
jgi:hypothetical protein